MEDAQLEKGSAYNVAPKNYLSPKGYREGAAFEGDRLFYRIVAISLGIAIIMGVVGAFVLALDGKKIPQILLAVSSAAVGALAGVLTTSRRK